MSEPAPTLIEAVGAVHDESSRLICSWRATALSEKQYRDKIVAIKRQQLTGETNRGKARAVAVKHRADAAKDIQEIQEIQEITARTSVSMARTYQRNAENLPPAPASPGRHGAGCRGQTDDLPLTWRLL
jgi:hypothetical protein